MKLFTSDMCLHGEDTRLLYIKHSVSYDKCLQETARFINIPFIVCVYMSIKREVDTHFHQFFPCEISIVASHDNNKQSGTLHITYKIYQQI